MHVKVNSEFSARLHNILVKFIYSEMATKFCEISTLLLSVCTVDKSKLEISKIVWPSHNIRTLKYFVPKLTWLMNKSDLNSM